MKTNTDHYYLVSINKVAVCLEPSVRNHPPRRLFQVSKRSDVYSYIFFRISVLNETLNESAPATIFNSDGVDDQVGVRPPGSAAVSPGFSRKHTRSN